MKTLTASELARRGAESAKSGDHTAAITFYRQALELDPGQPVQVYAGLGNQLLKNNQLDEAEQLFQSLIHQYPDRPPGFVGLARVVQRRHEWKTALERWNVCLEKFPQQAQIGWYVAKGHLLLNLEQFDEAERLFRNLSEKYPDQPQGVVGLARTAQSRELWEMALEYWNICLERFPQQVQSGWRLDRKRVLLELGRMDEVWNSSNPLESVAAKAYFSMLNRSSQNRLKNTSLKFDTILIITYGRSGSTLLQGILNTIDGVLVRGENDNIFYNLFLFYEKITVASKKYGSAIFPNQPWYGIGLFEKSLLLSHIRDMVRDIILGDKRSCTDITCYGFKEIRYNEIVNNLFPYLDFLNKIFQNAVFIFNTRNIDDVLKSNLWKSCDQETARKELILLESLFDEYCQVHPNCFQMTYEEILAKGSRLEEMFQFLGAEYRAADIDIVLSTPHSYEPTQATVKKIFEEF